MTFTLNTILLRLNGAASTALMSAEDLCKSRTTMDKYVNESTDSHNDRLSVLLCRNADSSKKKIRTT